MRDFISPTTDIARRGSLRLRRFDPLPGVEAAGAEPVLLVPSIINKPYVFDISEDRSFVKHLLGEGLTVYVIDWGEPRRIDAGLGLVDYALRLIRFAVNKARADAGVEGVRLLGYCLGGTFSLIASAAGVAGISGVVALTTPVDLSEPGPMGRLTQEQLFPFDALTRGMPILPGRGLQAAFQSLDPTGTNRKVRGLFERMQDEEFVRRFVDLETWVNDPVDMTAKAARDIVERLYQGNELARGELRLGDWEVDLSQGAAPVLNLVAQWDTIVPAQASTALEGLWGGPVETHIFPGGHLGVIVGSKAPKNMWAVTARWLKRAEECHA